MKLNKKSLRWFARWTGRHLMFILFLAAMLLRLLLLRFRFAVSFDESHYLRLAGSFFSQGLSGLLHPYWPPLFPMLIAAAKPFTGNLEWAGHLLNATAGSLLVVLVYRLALELVDRREAVLSAFIVAFHPALAFMSTDVMPETTYALLGIGGMLTGWKAFHRKSWLLSGLAGALWGLAYLAKPEATGFPMVYAILLILFWKRARNKPDRLTWAARLAVLCIGFAIVAAPYLVYLRQATGTWTLSTKGMVNQQMEAVVLLGAGDTADPFFHLTADNRHLPYDMAYHSGDLQDLLKRREGRERVIRLNPVDYAVKFMKNFYRVERNAVPSLFTLVLLVSCALGFFSPIFGRERRKGWLYCIAFIAFYWFLLIPFFHVNERYFIPLLPVALIWSGRGLFVLKGWIVRYAFDRRKRSMTAWVLLSVWGAAFFAIPEAAKVLSVRPSNPDMWAQPVEMKEAGLWLKNFTGHPPILMSLNKSVDFYAGQVDIRKGASFSYDSVERNVAYARLRGVEYMVFSSRYLGWFPNLRPLFDAEIPSPFLDRIYDRTRPEGVRTVIFRVTPHG